MDALELSKSNSKSEEIMVIVYINLHFLVEEKIESTQAKWSSQVISENFREIKRK